MRMFHGWIYTFRGTRTSLKCVFLPLTCGCVCIIFRNSKQRYNIIMLNIILNNSSVLNKNWFIKSTHDNNKMRLFCKDSLKIKTSFKFQATFQYQHNILKNIISSLISSCNYIHKYPNILISQQIFCFDEMRIFYI